MNTNIKLKDKYFTAGELAKLHNISKQTLLFYEKCGLIQPECIGDNNYRYYDLPQYFILEMVVILRNLDMPIKSIKKYLEDRSVEKFISILESQKKHYNNLLSTLIEKEKKIEEGISFFNDSIYDNFNVVSIEYWPIRKILKSESLNNKVSSKKKIRALAELDKLIMNGQYLKHQQAGWTISHKSFFDKKFNDTHYFFYTLNENDIQYDEKMIYILPKGYYLRMLCKGSYHFNSEKIYDAFISFAQTENLLLVGDVLVLPKQNHWFANDTNKYINEIFIKTKPK